MIDDALQKDWGLVLAGGGGKGSYQIGAYKAIMEAGLHNRISAISGSSVGTLNMALLSMDDIELAYDVWKSISPSQFIEADISKMFDGKEGFVSREGLVNIIDSYINRDKIRNDVRPMYATLSRYTDYVTETAVTEYTKLNNLEYEQMKQVLLASSALPIVYEPVKIGNYVYQDGGLTDNMPIKPLYDLGMRNIIVIMLSKNTKIPYNKYPDANFIEIRPSRDLGDLLNGTLDFTSKGAMIRMALGYSDANRYLTYYGSDIAGTPGFDIKMMEMADEDYRQILNTYHVDEIGEYIDNSVSNVQNYFDKYDIDL